MPSTTFAICPQCTRLVEVDIIASQLGDAKCQYCTAELPFHGIVNEFNDHTLQLMIKHFPHLLVVDFYANWCRPCIEYIPIFSRVADHIYEGVVWGRISCEFNPVMAQSLAIKGIPHTLFFRQGQELDRQVGVLTEKELENLVHNYRK